MKSSATLLRCRQLPRRLQYGVRRAFADNRRPSIAPKPIVDIKHIRQNPELYERTCEERNYRRQAGNAQKIVALHDRWQELQRQGRSLRERSNLLRKFLANPATSSGDEELGDVREMTREQVQQEARQLKGELSGIERGEAEAVAEMESLALEMPNLTDDETPRGKDPVLLGYINSPPTGFDDEPENRVWRSHVHIGTELGILDFAGAATASGWGWYYLLGEAAQLEQALVQYALDVASRRGWTQAGARGVDTKGLYRVHEFTKVEMFAWTAPEHGAARRIFDEMLDIQAHVLASLGLYCRVLAMPSADLGASASRKVDVEAYFPSRRQINDGWGELTSASLCTDYQARRLSTRTRVAGVMSFPYTANATALAVPRVIAALLENGWDEETGTVAIPECLRPWMGGKDRIVGRKRGAGS
ncbi:hypothetical protein HIM_01570 [Hirsutella minnesotensis 3608]|nr:hypothetical protein HIM_01570 [Hirsutella minnesotensis 3608]